MSEMIPWFTRSFPFPIPPELLPNIQSRLRGTPARLEELVQGIDSELLRRKAQARWSIQEHVGHLLDLDALWLARVQDYGKGASELTPTDLKNTKTEAANHNAKSLPGILQAFRAARMRLLQAAQGADTSGTVFLPHPRLRTPMSLIDHLYFVAEHDDHHLAVMHALAIP